MTNSLKDDKKIMQLVTKTFTTLAKVITELERQNSSKAQELKQLSDELKDQLKSI